MKRRLFAALLAFALLIGTVPVTPAQADDSETAKTVTVALRVGEETTITDTTGNYAGSPLTGLDDQVATVSMVGTDASTTLGDAVTTLTSGDRYMIVNHRGGMAINNTKGIWYEKTGLAFSKVDDLDPNAIWTIEAVEGGYTIRDAAGQYIQGGELTAGMGETPDVLTLTYEEAYLWRLSKGEYYLNDAGNDHWAAFFWKEYPYDAPKDEGSWWDIYPVNETEPSTAITFRGVAAGTTAVTLGSTTYQITVTEQNGHNYVNGFCTDSGCDAPYEEAKLNDDGVYEIGNGGQLYWFAKLVRGGSLSASAKLTADITVNPGTFSATGGYTAANGESRRSWTPLGSESAPYTGTFDGGGYSISGVYYSNSNTEVVGLFAYLGAEGTVQDLLVTNSYFGGKTKVGGVVGYNAGGKILRCGNGGYVKSLSTSSTYSRYVGGVVGYDENGTIQDCYNSGTITAMTYVGGVIGYEFGREAAITGCYNTGTVRSTGDASSSNNKYVGGIVGYTQSSLSGCYNTGSITGAACTGGIVGFTSVNSTSSITVSDCYNTGTVTSNGTYSGAYYIGGIVGDSYGGTTISKCYNTGTVTATVSNVGGITGGCSRGTTYAVYVNNCYNTGSVTGTYEVGGIVGNSIMNVTNCYNVGAVHGTNAKQAYVGGVVGSQNDNRELTNNYYLSGCATDGNDTVQNGVGQKELGVTTADVEGQTTAKTETQFASGEVTYLLNGSTSEGTEEAPLVWFQTVQEGLPSFNGKTVYFRDGEYTNEDATHVHVYDQEVASDSYKKSDATCSAKAVYYKSCSCGEMGTETFAYGELGDCVYDSNGFCTAKNTHYQPAVQNESGVYEISNAGQLYWFAKFVDGKTLIAGADTEDTADDVYSYQADAVLTKDIVVNTGLPTAPLDEDEADEVDFRTWNAIGNTTTVKYAGTFDGQNHTISGLYYWRDNTLGGWQGLIATLDTDGVVRNVTLADSYIHGYRYVGGIVGNNYGTVENCTNSSMIYGTSSNVGGVVGYNAGTITRCVNSADAKVYGENGTLGGIAGYNGENAVTAVHDISLCTNAGRIVDDSGTAEHPVGGIVGFNEKGTVSNCANTGAIEATGDDVGGVVGKTDRGTIQNCYNVASVTGDTYVGGILGRGYNTYTLQNCFYLTGCAKDSKEAVQNGVGYKTAGQTTEDVTGKTTVKSAAQFTSGEVTYLLNSAKSDENVIWRQTLGTDAYPVFQGKIVYFDEDTDTYYNEKEAHTHDFAQSWSSDADSHWHACSGCDEKGDEAQHTYDQQNTDSQYFAGAANCQSAATYYYSCICGAKGTKTFESGEKDMNNHTGKLGDWQHNETSHWKEYSCCGTHAEEAAHSGGNATCTEKAECSACHEKYGDLADHVYDQEVVAEKYLKTAANCQSAAVYYKSCSCGEKGTETFESGEKDTSVHAGELGDWQHNETSHWKEYSCCGTHAEEAAHAGGNATCTEKAECSVCHEKYGDLADHVYDQEVATETYLKSAANCQSAAVYYKSCSCGEKGTETFESGEKDLNNHAGELGDWQHNETSHWKEYGCCGTHAEEAAHSGGNATCTEKAECSVCHEKYGDLADHVYDQEVATDDHKTTAATCTARATYYKSCSCGKNGTETFQSGEVNSENHTGTLGEWKHNEANHWKEYSCCGTHAEEAAHSGGNATCTEKAECSTCGEKYGSLADHTYDQEVVAEKYLKTAANCQSAAVYYKSCSCGANGTETFQSGEVNSENHTGTLGEWKHNETNHWKEYSCCGVHAEEAAHKDEDGNYVCDDCQYNLPQPETSDVIRLEGSHRHETAIKTAEQMKEVLGVEKFDAIIVAYGYEYYDALAGSYLSAAKSAPILLGYGETDKYAYLDTDNIDYIKANLNENGTVYILGGESAVPALYETELSGYNVNRLGGDNRFETNLMILNEVGIPAGSEILVCTATNFADCLSAAATGKPILLVWNERGTLYGSQPDFLNGLENCTFTIIGGEAAVSDKFEEILSDYGTVDRVAGDNRLATSVEVAKNYFQNADSAVLAWANNFPDGLCGGALAYAMKSPLILTNTQFANIAADYTGENGITTGVVLGGESQIADSAVREIFTMAEDAEITRK